MIESIEIKNFKCFKHLKINNCNRINVIVGDNGVGKTALLEAIFLPLCTNPQKAINFRQWRGLDGTFSGRPWAIEQALYGDLFSDMDPKNPVEINLRGTGPEARSVRLSKGRTTVLVSPGDSPPAGTTSAAPEIDAPINFEWTNDQGKTFTAKTKITGGGIQFETTGEELPDFYLFPSASPIPSAENADRFSQLSTAGLADQLIESIRKVFTWLESLSVESIGGAPVLHAKLKGVRRKIPVTSVSGATNRIIAFLIAIAQRKRGVVMIDEVENGVFYTRHVPMIRTLLQTARDNECQVFVTSHSREWLSALVEAVGKDVGDIALWRIERDRDWNVELHQFSGQTLRAGVEQGVEVRGGDE